MQSTKVAVERTTGLRLEIVETLICTQVASSSIFPLHTLHCVTLRYSRLHYIIYVYVCIYIYFSKLNFIPCMHPCMHPRMHPYIYVHTQMEIGHRTHSIPGFVCCHQSRSKVTLCYVHSHVGISSSLSLGHQCLQEWFLLDWRTGPLDGPVRGIPGTSSLSAGDAAHRHVCHDPPSHGNSLKRMAN